MSQTDPAPPSPWMAASRLTPRLTLRRRIIGSVAILSALGLLAAGLAALVVERDRVGDRVNRSLQQEISEFRELATQGVDPATGEPFSTADRLITVAIERNVPDAHQAALGFVEAATIVAADGVVGLHEDERFRAEVTRHTTTTYGRYTSPSLGEVLYAVLPIEHGDQTAHYVVIHDMRSEFQELDETIRVYAVAALLAWLGLVLAAWLLARRILAPIEELSETAELISETDLNRRITVNGGDEVAAMATTVNRMLDRLHSALGAQRRMLDDAGHELRTPITIVRGHLELMDSTDPEDVESTRSLVLDELDRMNLLVQDLLLLAKAQRPDFLTREPVELHLLLEDTLDKASVLGDRRWLLDPCEPLTVYADPRRLTQALLQLASNAYKVTGPGDLIALGCSSAGDRVQLWVRDSGPGVPPADRQRVWERFTSGTGVSTGGTGLGLAIVRAIAEAHEGTARVTSATAAGGAKFVIDLPGRSSLESRTYRTLTQEVVSDQSGGTT